MLYKKMPIFLKRLNVFFVYLVAVEIVKNHVIC